MRVFSKVVEESVMFLQSFISFARKEEAITIPNDVGYIQMRQFGFTCHCILISK